MFSRIFPCLLLVALFAVSGCSTIIEGRTQKITVDTSPEGANCMLRSNDVVLGTVVTPGTLTVDKSKYDIIAECTKDGYIKTKLKNHSDIAISGIGNMVLGQWSFVGTMLDSATGAGNKYDTHMLVELDRDQQPKLASLPLPVTPPAAPAPLQAAALPESERMHQAVPVTPVEVASLAAATPVPQAVPLQAVPIQAVAAAPVPLSQVAIIAAPVPAPRPEPTLDVTKLSDPGPLLQMAALPESMHQSATEELNP